MIAALRQAVNQRLEASQKEWLLRSFRRTMFVVKYPYRTWKSVLADGRMPVKGRAWRSFIPTRLHLSAVNGTLKYTYRGIPMQMHPIDMALYTKLLWELKPRSIIELGTKYGGGAIWFGDMMKLYQLPCVVTSIDITRPEKPWHCPDNVVFVQGDEGNLGPLKAMFAELPHPWLIVNDASHVGPIILRGMNFLHQFLQSGDYMVIEDGFLAEAGEYGKERKGGPPLAISQFLATYPKDYAVDIRYCDFYGYNATPNANGWLRRL